MRTRFDEQLEQLHVELITMGALCEEAITLALKSLFDRDRSLVPVVLEKDGEIDRKERDIEALCMRLLLQQQPVARDLRTISSALKMISDMERIGDQAADIGELTDQMHDKQLEMSSSLHIRSMSEEAVKMVTQSVDSFVKADLELAHSVIAYDDVVDNLFSKIRGEIIEQIATDGTNGEVYIDLLMIAKYLERVADHATNIAEWVEYSITGIHGEMDGE